VLLSTDVTTAFDQSSTIGATSSDRISSEFTSATTLGTVASSDSVGITASSASTAFDGANISDEGSVTESAVSISTATPDGQNVDQLTTLFITTENTSAREDAQIQTGSIGSSSVLDPGDVIRIVIDESNISAGDADSEHPTPSTIIAVGRRSEEKVTRVDTTDNDNTSDQESDNENTSDQESKNENTSSVRRSNNTVTLQ
jgi:hypothetical protein